MPKTPTEILAEALGWERIPDDGPKTDKCYKHKETSRKVWLREGKFDGGDLQNWPTFDPADERSWYWMRRVEEELARRGLIDRYWQALLSACPGQITSTNALLLPLDARVAAAVKVLEVGNG